MVAGGGVGEGLGGAADRIHIPDSDLMSKTKGCEGSGRMRAITQGSHFQSNYHIRSEQTA